MLDFVHETLDQMAFTIAPGVILVGHETVGFGRNNGKRLMRHNELDKGISIIASVSQNMLKDQTVQQANGLGDVMPFAAGQPQAPRIAQTIDTHMAFGGKSTTRTPQALCGLPTVFLSAPAAHALARITVLSTITFSIS